MSKETGIEFKEAFTGSTGNVIKFVLLGKAEAGATLDTDLSREPQEVASQLRAVLKTPPRAPHPLAAHPRVPKKVRDLVTQAVLRLGADASGENLLKSVRLSAPVRAVYTRDYKDLEDIDIRTLSTE